MVAGGRARRSGSELVGPSGAAVRGFLLRLIGYLLAAAALYPVMRRAAYPAVMALMTATARIEYAFFALFTSDAILEDRTVSLGGAGVRIVEECTAIHEMIVFSGAVLAFRAPWRDKLVGIGAGLPVLYLVNLLRIGALLLVDRYLPEYFEWFHVYFWQATLLGMIAGAWWLWVAMWVRHDAPAAA